MLALHGGDELLAELTSSAVHRAHGRAVKPGWFSVPDSALHPLANFGRLTMTWSLG